MSESTNDEKKAAKRTYFSENKTQIIIRLAGNDTVYPVIVDGKSIFEHAIIEALAHEAVIRLLLAGATMEDIASGKAMPDRLLPAGKSAKEKPMSNKLLAIAYAHAEATAKGAVRPQPGKRLFEAPAFAPYLKTAKAIVAKFSKTEIADAIKHGTVLDHFRRLEGKSDSLGALFAKHAEEPASDQTAELQAAE